MQTKLLTEFLSSAKWDQVDDATVNYAKMCVEDCIGVSIAGSVTSAPQILQQYFSAVYPSGTCTVLNGQMSGASPTAAAAINAAQCHAMDLDDLHNSSTCHLGVITIPTALALSQVHHKTGQDLLMSTILGYEAGARIGEAIMPAAYRYWHTTSLVGGFSSSTVAAYLLGLSNEQLQHCFGSAGTQAGGLWAFLDNGSMSKCLHVANANLCGIRSAELAKRGFTGATDILENDRGFVKAFAPQYDLSRITCDLGKGWKINSNSFKPYACCRHTHSADYGILEMQRKHGFGPNEIVSIRDDTYKTAFELVNNTSPQNEYAAKFSLQYCIAAALLFGRLDNDVFSLKNLHNSKLSALMQRIELHVTPETEAIHQADPNKWIHRLTVTLSDGRVLTESFQYPLGDFNKPFDWDRMDQKFLSITADVLPEDRARKLIDRLHRLDSLEDISSLFVL